VGYSWCNLCHIIRLSTHILSLNNYRFHFRHFTKNHWINPMTSGQYNQCKDANLFPWFMPEALDSFPSVFTHSTNSFWTLSWGPKASDVTCPLKKIPPPTVQYNTSPLWGLQFSCSQLTSIECSASQLKLKLNSAHPIPTQVNPTNLIIECHLRPVSSNLNIKSHHRPTQVKLVSFCQIYSSSLVSI